MTSAAKVLLVDDMNGVRRSVAHVLRSLGHDVSEAENGAIAIEMLKSSTYDLIVTDILMPEKDGCELIEFAKTLPSHPRIIAMSGGGSQATADQAIDRARGRADGVLLKPFNRHDIIELVDRMLAA